MASASANSNSDKFTEVQNHLVRHNYISLLHVIPIESCPAILNGQGQCTVDECKMRKLILHLSEEKHMTVTANCLVEATGNSITTTQII